MGDNNALIANNVDSSTKFSTSYSSSSLPVNTNIYEANVLKDKQIGNGKNSDVTSPTSNSSPRYELHHRGTSLIHRKRSYDVRSNALFEGILFLLEKLRVK